MRICAWCCERIPFWRTYCRRCKACLTDKFNCSAPGQTQSCRDVLDGNLKPLIP